MLSIALHDLPDAIGALPLEDAAPVDEARQRADREGAAAEAEEIEVVARLVRADEHLVELEEIALCSQAECQAGNPGRREDRL